MRNKWDKRIPFLHPCLNPNLLPESLPTLTVYNFGGSQKYKHKVGRKLPPAKNTTNTEIKSKSEPSLFASLLLVLTCRSA